MRFDIRHQWKPQTEKERREEGGGGEKKYANELIRIPPFFSVVV